MKYLNYLNYLIESREWGIAYGRRSYCLDEDHPIIVEIDGSPWTKYPRTGDCYKLSCDSNDTELYIELHNAKYKCDNYETFDMGANVDGFKDGQVYCLSHDDVCPNIGCPNDCSLHGDCINKTCYCHLGYSGTLNLKKFGLI